MANLDWQICASVILAAIFGFGIGWNAAGANANASKGSNNDR